MIILLGKKKKKRLEKNLPENSSSLIRFKKNIEGKIKEFEILNSKVKVKVTNNSLLEEEIRQKINTLEKQKYTNDTLSSNLISSVNKEDKLNLEIKDDENKIKSLYNDIVNVDKLENDITILEVNLKKLKENEEKYIRQLDKLKKYEKYIIEHKEYTSLVTEYEFFVKEEKEIREKVASVNRLQYLVGIAESKAIENVINSINIYAQQYLEAFFIDDPINVTLSSFKEMKNKRKKNLKSIYQLNIKGLNVILIH